MTKLHIMLMACQYHLTFAFWVFTQLSYYTNVYNAFLIDTKWCHEKYDWLDYSQVVQLTIKVIVGLTISCIFISYCGVYHPEPKVPRWWPQFLWLSIWFGPYCMVQPDPIDPLFLQKNQFVSITFSSRDTWT